MTVEGTVGGVVNYYEWETRSYGYFFGAGNLDRKIVN